MIRGSCRCGEFSGASKRRPKRRLHAIAPVAPTEPAWLADLRQGSGGRLRAATAAATGKIEVR